MGFQQALSRRIGSRDVCQSRVLQLGPQLCRDGLGIEAIHFGQNSFADLGATIAVFELGQEIVVGARGIALSSQETLHVIGQP